MRALGALVSFFSVREIGECAVHVGCVARWLSNLLSVNVLGDKKAGWGVGLDDLKDFFDFG